MPRETPVTRAIREARGRVITSISSSSRRKPGPILRGGYEGVGRSWLVLAAPRRLVAMGPGVPLDDGQPRIVIAGLETRNLQVSVQDNVEIPGSMLRIAPE